MAAYISTTFVDVRISYMIFVQYFYLKNIEKNLKNKILVLEPKTKLSSCYLDNRPYLINSQPTRLRLF